MWIAIVLACAILGLVTLAILFGKNKAQKKVYKNAAATRIKMAKAAKRSARTIPELIKRMLSGKF